jgi:hypothetical protein
MISNTTARFTEDLFIYTDSCSVSCNAGIIDSRPARLALLARLARQKNYCHTPIINPIRVRLETL